MTLATLSGRMSNTPKIVTLVTAAALAIGACAGQGLSTPPATAESPATAPPDRARRRAAEPDRRAALATMNDRLKEYVDLHLRLERTLPKLPDEATPQQIDKNQRAFEKLVRDARHGASRATSSRRRRSR